MSEKIDLKITPTESKEVSSIRKPYYPSFYVEKELPNLSGDDVGKKIMAKVNLKLSGYSENKSSNKSRCSFNFDILDIQFMDGAVEAAKDNLNKRKY